MSNLAIQGNHVPSAARSYVSLGARNVSERAGPASTNARHAVERGRPQLARMFARTSRSFFKFGRPSPKRLAKTVSPPQPEFTSALGRRSVGTQYRLGSSGSNHAAKRRAVLPFSVSTHDGKQIVQTIGTVGQAGEDDKHFNRPTFLTWLPDSTMFVSDGYNGHRVVKFDKNGKFLMAWGGKKGQLPTRSDQVISTPSTALPLILKPGESMLATAQTTASRCLTKMANS